jgi:two-component system, LytTR family, response regulator
LASLLLFMASHRTILIDDEKLAVSRLERLLSKHGDTFEVIGRAYNGAEGLLLVEELKPDLIFLDIEMPLLNGFEMLAKVNFMPKVVFTTAFEEYAIRAFEENSIDYLLKPIEEERLTLTVQKLHKLPPAQSTDFYSTQMLKLLEQMKPKKEIASVSVKSGNKILILPLTDISYFEAEEKYVFLVATDGAKYLTNYTITTLEEKLPGSFVRVSRSVILNSTLLREAEKHFSGKYVLQLNDKNRSKITSGMSYIENVRKLLEM